MKRLIWCICAVCTIFVLATLCAGQDVWVEPAAHMADWQAMLRDPILPFTESGVATDSGTWYYRGGASDGTQATSGVEILEDGARLVLRPSATADTASVRYRGSISVRSARALSIGVYISDLSAAEDRTYAVTITCRSDGVDTVYQTDLPANRRVAVHLSAEPLGDTVTALAISVAYDRENPPERMEWTPPVWTERNPWLFAHLNAAEITAEDGRCQVLDGEAVYLFPDANGNVTVTAAIADSVLTYDAGERVLTIALDGVETGGTLTCVLTEESGETVTTRPVRVTGGVRYRIATGTIAEEGEQPWRTYTLRLENVTATDGYSFALQSVAIETYKSTAGKSVPILGGLEKYSLTLGGTVNDRQLDCSGKIRRELVRQYSGDQIVLLALPEGEDGESVTLAAAPVANTFDFRVAFAPLGEKADTWLYTVAIREKDENGDARDLYLTKPRYFGGREPSASVVSTLGLENASAMGVYESNVSHVVVDVPLNTLLAAGEKSVLCRRGDTTVALNADFLRQLDGDIPFYAKAGLEIWLRITSDTPIAGLTYDSVAAASYLPCLAEAESAETYGALLSYLLERYDEVDGILLGRGLNCEKYVGARLTDTVMDELGQLAAYTYRIASAQLPGIMLVLPFADGYTYRGEAVRCPEADTYNPEGVCARIVSAMDEKGDTPWLLGWYFHNDSESQTAITAAIGTSLAENDSYSGVLYFWEPDNTAEDKANLVARYENLTNTVGREKPRAVVLSLRRIYTAVAQKTYAAINGIGTGERSVVNLTATVGESAQTLAGQIRLWDFTALYHNDSWLAGGGITSLITDYSQAFSDHDGEQERSLQSVMPFERYADTTEGIAGGILLGDFAQSVDCDGVTDLAFTIAVRGTSRPVTLLFLVGADDCRAEYAIDPITADGVYTVHCDLTAYPYAQNVEYVGILIYAESDVVLEVSSVTAGSAAEDGQTLRERFYPIEKSGDMQSQNGAYAAYFLVLVAIFTFCTIALLNRRDREEAERAETAESVRHPGNPYRSR